MRIYFLFLCFMIANFLLTACQDKADDLKFDKFDKANKIVIQFPSTGSPEIVIEDLEKIEFAKEFIKRYPNGWEKPALSPVPTFSVLIDFYDNEQLLDRFGVGPDFLVYGPYWRPLAIQDRILLIETLDIPTE